MLPHPFREIGISSQSRVDIVSGFTRCCKHHTVCFPAAFIQSKGERTFFTGVQIWLLSFERHFRPTDFPLKFNGAATRCAVRWRLAHRRARAGVLKEGKGNFQSECPGVIMFHVHIIGKLVNILNRN